MPKKLTLQHCIDIAKINGGKCLSSIYVDSRSKMLWECSDGHKWKATFGSIREKHWCGKCASNKQRLSIVDAQNVALRNGGICLSEKYINCHEKLLWKCKNGHVFEMSLRRNSTRWCRLCSIKKRALTIDDARALAAKNNGKCISIEYVHARQPLLWECKNGHKWSAALRSIKTGSWCPKCNARMMSDRLRLQNGLETAHDIAKMHNGKCLSENYVNNSTKLLWQCAHGHEWRASLSSVKDAKQWCPQCKLPKTQTRIKNMLESVLGLKAKSNYKDFDWLRNPKTNRKLEIDIWVEGIKLAVEYDGEQHFIAKKFWGGQDELDKTKYRDRVKDRLIKQHGNDVKYFIRFSYKDDLYIKDIIKKLKMVGIKC